MIEKIDFTASFVYSCISYLFSGRPAFLINYLMTTLCMTTKTKRSHSAASETNSTGIPGGRKVLSLVLLIAMSLTMHAQTRLPVGLSKSTLPDSVIEQRLIDLVLKGPEMEEEDHQAKVLEYQLKAARNNWTNLLTLSTSYNEQSFKQGAINNYPKYFFGITIPVGVLLSRAGVKTTKEAIEIGKLNKEELRRTLIASVLSKYRQYKAQTEIIALESGQMNELLVAFTQAEEKFKRNDISFDVFNTAQRARNDEQGKLINLRLQLDLIRLDIERMIGTSLDNVLK